MPIKNPPHPGGLVRRQCIEFGLDDHGRRRAGSHAHDPVGTGEREARDFSRNGRKAVEGFRRQRRNLAHAAGALRPCTGSRRPHQAQAAGIERGFVIIGKAHGHESADCDGYPLFLVGFLNSE